MYPLNVAPFHRPIIWIAISEYPNNVSAFAPPPCSKCVSMQATGIPLWLQCSLCWIWLPGYSTHAKAFALPSLREFVLTRLILSIEVIFPKLSNSWLSFQELEKILCWEKLFKSLSEYPSKNACGKLKTRALAQVTILPSTQFTIYPGDILPGWRTLPEPSKNLCDGLSAN